MSAHAGAPRRGWLSAVVSQLSDYVLEPVEDAVAVEPVELAPHLVVAVVSAARRSGASTVARLVAAEFGWRTNGAAVVAGACGRRAAPPGRASIRLATALTGACAVQATGRLCFTSDGFESVATAARYAAPVVLDVPPDGSGASAAALADRVVIVGAAAGERALLEAVATVIGRDALRVVNRAAAPPPAGVYAIPDSRLAARAAALGGRAVGAAGAAIAELVDALETPR